MIIFHGKQPQDFETAATSRAHRSKKMRPLLRFPQPLNGSACRGNAIGLALLTINYLQAAHGFALA
jgi:hypothetical protein